jgi:hypothetical protein
MKRSLSAAIIGCTAFAMSGVVGCATTHHVTETTTTREYDAPNTAPALPLASENTTTTTTHYNNGTVQQRTVTEPGVSEPPDQRTTTVTTDADNGNVQKRTTTTYSSPGIAP